MPLNNVLHIVLFGHIVQLLYCYWYGLLAMSPFCLMLKQASRRCERNLPLSDLLQLLWCTMIPLCNSDVKGML